MSLGYADRLTPKDNLGGQLGAPEYCHAVADVVDMVDKLVTWVGEGKGIFAFTGAGISTAIGIPDFRGPSGIWTLRKQKQDVPAMKTTFTHARPSYCHMALVALMRGGIVTYVSSQNVDCLHLRSGVPRDKLAELHGNCFAERCPRCKTEYVRDFEVETVGFKATGRACSSGSCRGKLVDNILDWNSALPDDELDMSIACAKSAGVALCLGTSLQIEPANDIPVNAFRKGGRMVIVNLQETPKDKYAEMIIYSRVDSVMALLVDKLKVEVPPYVRRDELLVTHSTTITAPARPSAVVSHVSDGRQGDAAGAKDRGTDGQVDSPTWGSDLCVASVHGEACAMPMVESVSLLSCDYVRSSANTDRASPSGGADVEGLTMAAARSSGGDADVSTSAPAGPPYRLAVRGVPAAVQSIRCVLLVGLVHWADEDKRRVRVEHEVQRPDVLSSPALGGSALPAAGGVPQSQVPLATSATGAVADVASCGGYNDAEAISSSGSGGTSRTARYAFVSQREEYDTRGIVNAFLASQPEVRLPPPRKKMKRKHDVGGDDSSGGSGTSGAGVEVVSVLTRYGRESKVPKHR